MTIVSESDGMGENIALTEAVEERRLGGSGSLHVVTSCLGSLFGFISGPKPANSDWGNGDSGSLRSSGMD